MVKNKACLEEFDLRVRRIKMRKPDASLTVFDAVVLTWRPIKKEWQETNQKIVCVGNFYGLIENDHLHVKAEELEHPIYGPQYQIYTSKRVSPGTEVEMKRFLVSINGVGVKNAERIIEELGLDVISSILKDPACLNHLGLKKPAKEGLYQAIVDNQFFEELLLFLQLNGISPKYTMQIYEKYGSNAVEKIRSNPYALYLDEVIDFQTADRLNQALGSSINYSHRILAGALACLREDSEKGNVFSARGSFSCMLNAFLNQSLGVNSSSADLPEELVDEALTTLLNDKYIVIDSFASESPAIYLFRNFYAERKVAERLDYLSRSPKRFFATKNDIRDALAMVQSETKLTLATEQAYGIETALLSPISILTGGPGTGKTQTLTMLIKTIKRLCPFADIRICAPTGKAAVRVQELTNMDASTIHRMIGYPQEMLQEDELICDFVIADEYSMSDIFLCSWMLNCICAGARVIIVGDHEQLPSIGPGLVLRDMIDSGCIPVTKLQTVFRQAKNSRIISNAHAIINSCVGQEIALDYAQDKGSDFYFIEADTQSSIAGIIQRSVKKLLADGIAMEQIEVLSSVHGGLIGTDSLNLVLQEVLNAGPPGYQLERGLDLRIGDKVIQGRNNYDLAVFNGETGIIQRVDYSPAKTVLVAFPNRDVWYDSEQVEDLDLAYAMTTHRSQGSEFQVVIIPIHETILHNINRNLLYTAITRAKEKVIFVGTKSALSVGLEKNGVNQRNSNLIVRLQTQFFVA